MTPPGSGGSGRYPVPVFRAGAEGLALCRAPG